MINEHTLNGYCIAMEEINGTSNHACEFSFRKVNMISDDWDEALTEHFRSAHQPDYSDYESYKKVANSLQELHESLKDWFNSYEILKKIYKGDNKRAYRFLELFKKFQNGRKYTLYKIKDKGGYFVSCDYYMFDIEGELYTLELGTND